MNELPVRRIAATLTIGSFSIAALMGIIALLGGGEFGEGEGRVLLTTLIVGSASICMLCYLATGGTRYAGVGIVGAITLVLPVSTALVLVWSDWDRIPEGLIKSFGIGVVLAVTLAQVSLLLSDIGGRPGLRPILGVTVALATVLAALVSTLILGEIDFDAVWRLVGVIAILDVLGTLVTIAIAKFGGRDSGPGAAGATGELGVVLPPQQAAQIAALARSTGRPADELVREAVERYLQG